jgi:2-octaprenyl-6-methoxyphenol hydroxylase
LPALSFALALRQALGRAVAITICDPLLDRPRRDDRAFALSPAVVRMFVTLGLWPAIRAGAEPIRTMLITDGRLDDPVRPARLTFDNEDGSPLGHVVEAADLAPPLRQACDAAGIVFASTAVDRFAAGRAPSRSGRRTGRRAPPPCWSPPTGRARVCGKMPA